MNKIFLLLFLFLSQPAFAGYVMSPYTGKFDRCMTVKEEDGSPVDIACNDLKVTNGSLTDNGDGTFSLATGSGGGSGNVGVGTTNLVPIYVGVSTLGPSSGVYIVGGNLGIGSTAPQAKLTVIGSGTGTSSTVMLRDSSFTPRTVFQDDGNIGVGSLSPGTTLDIVGATRITNNSISGGVGLSNTTSSASFTGQLLSVASTASNSNVTGELVRLNASGAATNALALHIVNGGTGQTILIEDTALGTDITPFVIDAAGNVGVGTTTATNGKFVTNAGAGVQALVVLKDATFNSESSAGISIGDGTSDTGLLLGTDKANSVSYIQSLDPGTSYTTRALVLNPNGANVGIGTFAPVGKFVVIGGNVGIGTFVPRGQFEVRSSGVATSLVTAQFQVSTAGSSNMLTGGVLGASGANLPYLQGTFAGASTVATIINPLGGNVGIGTVLSPINKFEVAGNVAVGAGYAGISSGPSNGIIVQGNVGVGTSAPQGKFIVLGGNVGIGTWTTTHALDLTPGTTNAFGIGFASNMHLYRESTTGLTMDLNNAGHLIRFGAFDSSTGQVTADGSLALGAGGGGAVIMAPGAVQTALFATGGNVGIGTTLANNTGRLSVFGGNVGISTINPGVDLDVTGTIRASTDIKIGANSVCQSTGTNCPAGSSNPWITTASVGIGTWSNVGIGTITPQTNLVVLGNVGIGTWTDNTTNRGLLNAVGGSNEEVDLIINNKATGNAATAGLQARSTGGAGYLIHANASYVQAATPEWADRLILFADTNTQGVNIEAPATGGSIRFSTADYGTAGQRAVIMPDGNVGIGTSGPRAIMEISRDNPVIIFNSTEADAAARNYALAGDFSEFGSMEMFVSRTKGANPIASASRQTSQSWINNGNVGIGTTKQASMFAVKNNISVGAYVATEAPTGGMIISGNVGIGSTAPQATLDLGTSGTLRSNRTTGIGFTVKAGAATACNTTCGASACVFGFDDGTLGVANSIIVSCTDASADHCVCAGP